MGVLIAVGLTDVFMSHSHILRRVRLPKLASF